jgi:hypothetical protein
MKCWVCENDYYPQTNLEPAEECLCGMGHGNIYWVPTKERPKLFLLKLMWKLVRLQWKFGDWTYKKARGLSENCF